MERVRKPLKKEPKQPKVERVRKPLRKETVRPKMKKVIKSLRKETVRPKMKKVIKSLRKETVRPKIKKVIKPLRKETVKSKKKKEKVKNLKKSKRKESNKKTNKSKSLKQLDNKKHISELIGQSSEFTKDLAIYENDNSQKFISSVSNLVDNKNEDSGITGSNKVIIDNYSTYDSSLKIDDCKFDNTKVNQSYIREKFLGNNTKCNEKCLKQKRESSELLKSQMDNYNLINQSSNKLSVINHINTVHNITNNRSSYNKTKIMDLFDNCTLNSVNKNSNNKESFCEGYTKDDDFSLI